MNRLTLASALAIASLVFAGPARAADPIAALSPIRANVAALHAAAQSARARGDAGTAAVAEYLAYRRDPAGERARFIASVGPNGPVSAAYTTAFADGVIGSSLEPYSALSALARGGDAAARTRLTFVRAHADGEVAAALGERRTQPVAHRILAVDGPFAGLRVGDLLRSTNAIRVSSARDADGTHTVTVAANGVQGRLNLDAPASSTNLSTGVPISLIPLAMGGSGGSFGAIVFTWQNGAPHYAGSINAPDGGLQVSVNGTIITAHSNGVQSSDGTAAPVVAHYHLVNGTLLKV